MSVMAPAVPGTPIFSAPDEIRVMVVDDAAIVRTLLTLYADWAEAPRSAQREAIAAQAATLRGQILRPQHTNNAETWHMDLNGAAKASLQKEGDVVLATVNAIDKEPWRVQMTQVGLDLEEGRRYTLSFGARADVDRSIAAAFA